MTQHDLDNISWTDIDLLEESGKLILILICSDQSKAGRFLQLLQTNAFAIAASINDHSKEYTIDFDFTDCRFRYGCHTQRTKENYNRLALLKSHKLTHLATAFRDKDNRLVPVPELLSLDNNIDIVYS